LSSEEIEKMFDPIFRALRELYDKYPQPEIRGPLNNAAAQLMKAENAIKNQARM
jgi:hypothetical protein